jgi:hypothetical protein
MKKVVLFFERPEVATWVRRVFLGSLVLLVILDFLHEKHVAFFWEHVPGFYALYGFLSCALIIAVSKLLGKFWLQKKEDYYE